MDEVVPVIERTRTLIARLERISADSIWSHRSSGLRGSLLRSLEQVEICTGIRTEDTDFQEIINNLEKISREAFQMLENAAREIRPPERMP